MWRNPFNMQNTISFFNYTPNTKRISIKSIFFYDLTEKKTTQMHWIHNPWLLLINVGRMGVVFARVGKPFFTKTISLLRRVMYCFVIAKFSSNITSISPLFKNLTTSLVVASRVIMYTCYFRVVFRKRTVYNNNIYSYVPQKLF